MTLHGTSRKDAAARWYARLRAPVVDLAEHAAFERWLAEDAANRQAWARIDTADAAASRVAADPRLQVLLDQARALPHVGRSPSSWRFAGMAAALVVAIVGSAAIWHVSHDAVAPAARTVAVAPPMKLYRTERGDRQTFRLADGSQVTLDTATRLEVAAPASTRRLNLLAGQALFKVAKDHAHPFIVHVGKNSVTALGTIFTVRAEPDVFSVSLVEGSVRVALPEAGRTTILKPGQTLTASGGKVTVSSTQEGATGWARGRLQFDAAPLSFVVGEMNRYTARKLIIADPVLGAKPVSGVFRTDGGVTTFVQALEASGMARADQSDPQAIYLRSF